MTAWLTQLHVATLRIRGALREYWKRIAVGALCGWLISSILGAIALVAFESAQLITAEDSTLLGAALVWMGIGVGGLVAYVARPEPIEERTSDR